MTLGALERRVGVVDVGSNSVRMVVFDSASRSPAYFFNEKVMCGLGKGLAETGLLNAEGKERALAALKRFCLLAQEMGLPTLSAVATAAVREAADGAAFQAQVFMQTGIDLQVIDGAEEARLSAQGVLLGWPEAEGAVCDIGGSSLELAIIRAGAVGARISLPIGPFRLQQIKGDKAARGKAITDSLRGALDQIGGQGARFYLVGGSWRAIARLDMALRDYPLTVLHEYRMQVADISETLDWIDKKDLGTLRAQSGSSSERIELVPFAAEVLRCLITVFSPAELDVSAYGIREGLLYEHMPADLRMKDPLIEAARLNEQSAARIPGAGAHLFAFLTPLFADWDAARLRLAHAACLLHDTAWRAHPDYRAEVCFDNATRANLGGLDHEGRIFLGLALLYRYKNSRSGARLKALAKLLTPEAQRDAEALGKAMRFGAMLAAGKPKAAGELRPLAAQNRIELHLTALGTDLYGEIPAARFQSLCAALGVSGRVFAQGKDYVDIKKV